MLSVTAAGCDPDSSEVGRSPGGPEETFRGLPAGFWHSLWFPCFGGGGEGSVRKTGFYAPGGTGFGHCHLKTAEGMSGWLQK